MKKRVLAVLLSAGMLLSTVPVEVFAGDVTGTMEIAAEEEPQTESAEKTDDTDSALTAKSAVYGDFEYTVDDNGVTITRYTGSESEVTIPDQIGGVDVVAIGDEAFMNHGEIETVWFPIDLREIGAKAFYGCTKLNLKSNLVGLDIGDYAFAHCGLTYLELDYDSLGTGAFSQCTSLRKVLIYSNVTSISSDCFSGDSSLSIYGYANTYAQTYAKVCNMPFYTVNDDYDENESIYISYYLGGVSAVARGDAWVKNNRATDKCPRNVSYDAETKTLTFNNYNYDGAADDILCIDQDLRGFVHMCG